MTRRARDRTSVGIEAVPAASVVGNPIARDVGAPKSLHTGVRAAVAHRPAARSVCAVNHRPTVEIDVCTPSRSTRFPSTCVLGKCAIDTALIVEAGGYRQLSVRKNLPRANAAKSSTTSAVDELHQSSQLGVFGKHSRMNRVVLLSALEPPVYLIQTQGWLQLLFFATVSHLSEPIQ